MEIEKLKEIIIPCTCEKCGKEFDIERSIPEDYSDERTYKIANFLRSNFTLCPDCQKERDEKMAKKEIKIYYRCEVCGKECYTTRFVSKNISPEEEKKFSDRIAYSYNICIPCQKKKEDDKLREAARKASVNSIAIRMSCNAYDDMLRYLDDIDRIVGDDETYDEATDSWICYFPKDKEEMIARRIAHEEPFPNIEIARQIVTTKDVSLLSDSFKGAANILEIYDRLQKLADEHDVKLYEPSDYVRGFENGVATEKTYNGAIFRIAMHMQISGALAKILLDNGAEEFDKNFRLKGINHNYKMHEPLVETSLLIKRHKRYKVVVSED